jgi:hypothetical protein
MPRCRICCELAPRVANPSLKDHRHETPDALAAVISRFIAQSPARQVAETAD